jgi:hypothetical protein
MYNIYELVDNICTKVKYSIKCEEEATRILHFLEYRKEYRKWHWPQRDANAKDCMRQAINDLRRLTICVAILELFGASWEVHACVDTLASDRRGRFDREDRDKRAADLEVLLDTDRIVSSIYSLVRRFIEDNRHRILDVKPKELEEFVHPNKHSVWLGGVDFGGHLGWHSAEVIVECKLVRR